MNTKRIRIVVSINTNGDWECRELNDLPDSETYQRVRVKSSREYMDQVYPDSHHHTIIVEAEVPLPEIVVVQSASEQVIDATKAKGAT